MIRLKSFTFSIYLVIALQIFTYSAFTQQASIAITPASLEATVKAGASYTQHFTLANGTNERVVFRCSAIDMWLDDQNRRINGRPGTLPRSASLWVQFTPSEVVVEPHASSVIKATITIPPGATGSFYTVPVFEIAPANKPLISKIVDTGVSTTSIGIRFRGLMTLTTEQGSEYNVEIMGGQVLPPTAASELTLSLDLRNRGSAHAKIRGAFAILDGSGRLAGRGNFEEKALLPTQQNAIRGKWSGELKPGNYTGLATLSYNRVGLQPFSLVYEIPFTVK
jgi:hypothetical protein